MICTGFLKYPFGHLFQTEIKIDLKTNWNFFPVQTGFFTACLAYKNQVRTEMEFSYSQTENFEMEKLSCDTGYFKKTSGDQQGVSHTLKNKTGNTVASVLEYKFLIDHAFWQ